MDGREREVGPELPEHVDVLVRAQRSGQVDTVNPRPRQPWRDVLAWAGAGLFSGALLFCLFGLARHLGLFGAELAGGVPEFHVRYWVLLALVAVVGLVLPHASLNVPEDERTHRDDRAAPAAPVTRAAPSSLQRIHTALLSAGSAILALLAVWFFPRYPLVPASGRAEASEAEVLLWACLVVLCLGGLLSVAAGRPPRRPSRPSLGGRALPVVSLTATALAALVVASALGPLTHPKVVHTVAAEDLGDPPPVPAGVSGKGWTWEPPPGTEVSEIAAGPHGPILLLDDGFVALDGATGAELWAYRELHRSELEAHLFEGVALLTHSPENEAATGTALDPATGEIISEQPDLADLQAYTPTASLHAYSEEGGTGGVEARAFERGMAGPGESLWTFVPQEPGLFCEYRPRPRTTADPVSGDVLLVVTYACVDPEEFEEKTLATLHPRPLGHEGILAHGGSVDSMVATVAALDPATGEEVWRYEHPVTRSWLYFDLEPAERSPSTGGEARVFEFWADNELFLLDPGTGEPLGHPEEALDRHESFGPAVDQVLRADTGGAVLALRGEYHGSEGPREVLTTDPAGETTARVTIDENELGQDHLNQAVALEDTLLVPYMDRDTHVMSVYAAPLAAGDLGGEWLELGSPLEPVFRQEHRLIAVPGAVVSYSTDASAEIRGLVS